MNNIENEFASKFKKGQIVEVEITAHVQFGIIVKVPGIKYIGLIHITNISEDIPAVPINEWPMVGTKLKAVVIGWRIDPSPELYLSLKKKAFTFNFEE